MLMEFWGVEVKSGQVVKCRPGDEKVIHLSQASLGEIKKEKGTENFPIFINITGQKLVLGTLSSDKCLQIPYDIVFEKEFELSHGSKNASVFFVGYKSISHAYESEDDLYDSDFEDYLDIDEKLVGKLSKSELGKSASKKVAAAKDSNVTVKAKTPKANIEQVKAGKKVENKDDEDDEDEDDDSDEKSDDEDMVESPGDSDGEEKDDSSEEEATPKKSETAKKRKADLSANASVPYKKAKVVTPAGNVKTGGDGKKVVHTATPHPGKQGGKPLQRPKSGGSVTCQSCIRTFYSDNALQAHMKAKHGAAPK